MDTGKYGDNIKKTGFFLEYKMGEVLREQGWSVISKRYYVDDVSETVREIDLIGYRTHALRDFTVFTVLLISCKKSERNLWALLSRDINPNDPNADWRPVHVWTNHRALYYMIANTKWRDLYLETGRSQGVASSLLMPEVEIYAFQEMRKDGATVQNDREIFDSVTSLMKAQAYELGTLPTRKKDKALYQFNLLSVVDSELIRLHFRGDEVEAIPVQNDTYIANYIVHRARTSARIHFVRATAFPPVLQDYARVHLANCVFFKMLCERYYEDAVRDPRKTAVFKKDFNTRVAWRVAFALREHAGSPPPVEHVSLCWDDQDNVLGLEVNVPEEYLSVLNEDRDLRKHTAEALNELYRYTGEFRFEWELPF